MKHNFKITIDDSMCAYEYEIPSDGTVSIHNIAELIHDYLKAETPLKGKYVEGSGEGGFFKDKKLPQFDRSRHGCLYDRGSADSYYRRPPNPHWYPEGTGNGAKIVDLTEEERKEYLAGYDENEEAQNYKEWD